MSLVWCPRPQKSSNPTVPSMPSTFLYTSPGSSPGCCMKFQPRIDRGSVERSAVPATSRSSPGPESFPADLRSFVSPWKLQNPLLADVFPVTGMSNLSCRMFVWVYVSTYQGYQNYLHPLKNPPNVANPCLIFPYKSAFIVGWWFQPLWKILVKWGYCSQYMEIWKNIKCSKPPTR
jgi:hypothetical protein